MDCVVIVVSSIDNKLNGYENQHHRVFDIMIDGTDENDDDVK